METTQTRPFSSRTRVALAISRGIAASRGDQDLTPLHIALGICSEGANPALAALWYAGLTELSIRALRGELERLLGEPPGHMPPRQVAIDLSSGEEDIIRLADVEAANLGDPYLGTEHILLGLLRFANPVSERLAQRGISLKAYEGGMTAMRRGDPPPSPPPSNTRRS